MGVRPALWGERVLELARHLVVRAAPEPRTTHTLFVLLVIADLGLRSLGPRDFDDLVPGSSWPAVGLSLILLAQVVAAVTPWQRIPVWLIGALPVADLAGLGLLRLTAEGSGSGILAVVPAVWLVWQFGLRGVATSAVMATVFLSLVPLVHSRADTTTVSQSVLDPLVVIVMSVAVWALITSARERQAEVASRSEELSAALEELDSARAWSTAIVDSVDVGLVLLGSRGEYLTTNTRHNEFLDLAFPDGHQGKVGQLGEVFSPDGVRRLARHEMPSVRAAKGEEFDDVRLWVGADPERRRALSVSARVVRDDDGEQIGAALTYTDVTDLMRVMAVKDDFVAMVSHEFRTPLTSIHGYATLLLDEEQRLEPDDVRYLSVIVRNTERLQRLVTDLLDSARFDGRPLDLELQTTEVADLVRTAVEAARPAAEAKGLELRCSTPRHLTALLDPQRIAQVVDNLLSNAVKYTDSGTVEIVVAAHDDHVEIRVSDTGMGIGEAERDRLFTRFFRTGAAEASSIQGAGLGLSITKKIVDAHRGRIAVESSALDGGRGTTFRVWLPLIPGTSEESPEGPAGDQVLAQADRVAR
jgi:two-component system, OmpR family, phosphate regulon sensor histidine kinase PhoR